MQIKKQEIKNEHTVLEITEQEMCDTFAKATGELSRHVNDPALALLLAAFSADVMTRLFKGEH